MWPWGIHRYTSDGAFVLRAIQRQEAQHRATAERRRLRRAFVVRRKRATATPAEPTTQPLDRPPGWPAPPPGGRTARRARAHPQRSWVWS